MARLQLSPVMSGVLGVVCGLAAACEGQGPSTTCEGRCDGTSVHSVVVSQSPIARSEREPHVAADGHGHVAVVWIAEVTDEPGFTNPIGYALSSDDGATFSAPRYLYSTTSASFSVDPTVAIDSTGHTFIVWMGVGSGDLGLRHIHLVAIEADGTVGAPLDLGSGGRLDKPWIALDGADDILVTWSDFDARGIVLARSFDHGASFATGSYFTDGHTMSYPCIDRSAGPLGPAAPLYITLGDDAPSTIHLVTTTDGSAFTLISATPLASGAVYGAPTCAVTPSSGGSELWIAHGAVGSSGDATWGDALVLLRSSDGGASFPQVTTVARAADPSTDDLFRFPELAATPGRLALLDYRGHPMGGQLVLTSSTDRGGHWHEVDLASVPSIATDEDTGLGDYVGLAIAGSATYSAFGDNASGATRIRFARIDAAN